MPAKIALLVLSSPLPCPQKRCIFSGGPRVPYPKNDAFSGTPEVSQRRLAYLFKYDLALPPNDAFREINRYQYSSCIVLLDGKN